MLGSLVGQREKIRAIMDSVEFKQADPAGKQSIMKGAGEPEAAAEVQARATQTEALNRSQQYLNVVREATENATDRQSGQVDPLKKAREVLTKGSQHNPEAAQQQYSNALTNVNASLDAEKSTIFMKESALRDAMRYASFQDVDAATAALQRGGIDTGEGPVSFVTRKNKDGTEEVDIVVNGVQMSQLDLFQTLTSQQERVDFMEKMLSDELDRAHDLNMLGIRLQGEADAGGKPKDEPSGGGVLGKKQITAVKKNITKALEDLGLDFDQFSWADNWISTGRVSNVFERQVTLFAKASAKKGAAGDIADNAYRVAQLFGQHRTNPISRTYYPAVLPCYYRSPQVLVHWAWEYAPKPHKHVSLEATSIQLLKDILYYRMEFISTGHLIFVEVIGIAVYLFLLLENLRISKKLLVLHTGKEGPVGRGPVSETIKNRPRLVGNWAYDASHAVPHILPHLIYEST